VLHDKWTGGGGDGPDDRPQIHGCHYRYISDDPSWSQEAVPTRKWRQVPEWAATYIEIVALYASTAPDLLPPLEALLHDIRGCVSTEVGDPKQRTRIVARFQRDVESEEATP
jgi:hypothetical protein